MAQRSRVRRPVARGDIVLVTFPFTDLSATKLRPALVLYVDAAQEDFVLAFISSQHLGHDVVGEITVLPAHPEFALTGLAAPSRIRTTKLVTLSGRLVRRWLGRLGPLLTGDLDRALIRALGINTAPFHEAGRVDERARLVALHRAGGASALLADLGRPRPSPTHGN